MGAFKRLTAALAVAIAGAAAGCEDSPAPAGDPAPERSRTEVGALAGLAAQNVDFYSEVSLELDAETRKQLGKVLTRLGGRPDSIVEARDGLLVRLTTTLPFARKPQWERDVAPWVGDRAAIFGEARDGEGEKAARTTAVTVADPDAAQDSLERLLEPGIEIAESDDGVRLFAADGRGAVALTEETMLLGQRKAVERALDGETRGLEAEKSFRDALADLEPEEDVSELGFVVSTSAERFERGFLEGISPGLESALGPDPLARLGLNADRPVSFELGVADGEAVIDFSYAPSEDPHLDRLRDLADTVPGGPLLLVEPLLTPALWESFKAGSKLTIDRVAENEGLDDGDVERLLGYDPDDVLNAVSGDFALYSTFDDDRGLALGVSGSTNGTMPEGAGVDFVETIATAPPNSGEISEFDVGPSGEAIRIESDALPFPAVFAQYPERVDLALGTTTPILERATDRGSRNGDAYGLIDADTDIGGDYLALGYAGLPSLSLYFDILAPDAGFPQISFRQRGFLILGGIYDPERRRTALRLRIDPPKLPPGSGPLDDLGQDDSSFAGSSRRPDRVVLASAP